MQKGAGIKQLLQFVKMKFLILPDWDCSEPVMSHSSFDEQVSCLYLVEKLEILPHRSAILVRNLDCLHAYAPFQNEVSETPRLRRHWMHWYLG